MQLIWTLLAFATESGFLSEPLPDELSYNLGFGFSASMTVIKEAIRPTAVSYEDSSESEAPPRDRHENRGDLERRRQQLYERNLDSEIQSAATQLLGQWPCSHPHTPDPLSPYWRLLPISKAMKRATPLFREWYRNKLFREHIGRVQEILSRVRKATTEVSKTYTFQPCQFRIRPAHLPTCMGSLLRKPIPEKLPNVPKPLVTKVKERKSPRDDRRLKSLISDLKQEAKGWDYEYANDLQESLEALHDNRVQSSASETLDVKVLAEYRDRCLAYMTGLYRTISSRLEALHDNQVEASTSEILDVKILAGYRDDCLAYMTGLYQTIRSRLE